MVPVIGAAVTLAVAAAAALRPRAGSSVAAPSRDVELAPAVFATEPLLRAEVTSPANITFMLKTHQNTLFVNTRPQHSTE